MSAALANLFPTLSAAFSDIFPPSLTGMKKAEVFPSPRLSFAYKKAKM